MTEEQFDEVMIKIRSMTDEELEQMMIEILEESGVEWTYGNEGIKFNGLLSKEKHDGR